MNRLKALLTKIFSYIHSQPTASKNAFVYGVLVGVFLTMSVNLYDRQNEYIHRNSCDVNPKGDHCNDQR